MTLIDLQNFAKLYPGLAALTAVFVAANAALKTYALQGGIWVLVGALALFCLGNTLMVQVMRANGLGIAIALSLIFQLIAITGVAFVFFGERPNALQLAGLVLGIIAINYSKTTGIVTAVLKATQPLDQYFNNILTRCCANDSAHYFLAFTDFFAATFFTTAFLSFFTGRCHCKEICLARDTVS